MICSTCKHFPVLSSFMTYNRVCRSLLVLLYFFVWPLCFLFDIRIMITPLVSLNSSYVALFVQCMWSAAYQYSSTNKHSLRSDCNTLTGIHDVRVVTNVVDACWCVTTRTSCMPVGVLQPERRVCLLVCFNPNVVDACWCVKHTNRHTRRSGCNTPTGIHDVRVVTHQQASTTFGL
jgi:hypothetical protein